MYLNKKQASEKMGISTRTLDRIRKEGKISTYAISPRNLRFDSGEVEAYARGTKEAT